MSSEHPRPETLAALDAVFSPSMSKNELSMHLALIATGIILALRQIEGDEFVLGFLDSVTDDIKQGNAYVVRRVKTKRPH